MFVSRNEIVDILWEIAHINSSISKYLKAYCAKPTVAVALEIQRLREERTVLEDKIGLNV